ncbi:MAG: ISAzo13 family transposase [Cyanobacteria bacterium J06614_10]
METVPALIPSVENIIAEHVAGSPSSEVKWTYLNITEVQSLLYQTDQLSVSWPVLKRIFKELKYGRRSLAKREVMKKQIPHRDAQFKRIAHLRAYYLARNYPVLSVDTKKKEHLGRFYRSGTCLSQASRTCFDHDFPSFSQGKIVPHGIYDLGRNSGHITLSRSRDTAEFNVECLRQYWGEMGHKQYPAGVPLLLLLDGGGSNGCRNRLFKQELQDWADEVGINIRVAHYPAYCSKYNPIEHRLFPTITRAWKGVMLDKVETMKTLIEKRTADLKSGLKVTVSILNQTFHTGVRVFDDFLHYCDIRFDDFLPERNYRVIAMPISDSY